MPVRLDTTPLPKETLMSKIVILGVAHPHIFGMTEHAKQAKGHEVAGVFDPDPALRRAAAEKMKLPEIDSLDRALALRPALAIMAAVPGERAAMVERCLAAGVPVFVDKPLVFSHQGLDRLIAAVKQHRKPVTTFYPYRGDPHVLAAKAMLDSGAIGKLVRVMSCGPHKLNPPTRPAWHWTAAGNGGALLDIGSHHADLCCFFAGEAPSWVSAQHGNFDQPAHQEFQDFAQAQFRFPSGAMGHLEVDWLNPVSMKNFGDTRIWLQGAKGKIEIRHGDESTAHYWTEKVAGAALDTGGRPSMDEWTVKLIEDLAGGGPGLIPQEDVWRASRATLHAFESAQAGGRPVPIPQ
jgi:predicted dehydrogenase